MKLKLVVTVKPEADGANTINQTQISSLTEMKETSGWCLNYILGFKTFPPSLKPLESLSADPCCSFKACSCSDVVVSEGTGRKL